MSHTKTMKKASEQAQHKILEVIRITGDQYNELMFTHGIQFAEHFCSTFLNREDLLAELLQDKKYMYWDWFRMIYKHDDVLMISNECLNMRVPDCEKYLRMKDCLIGDELLENDLYQFISDYL